MPQIPLDFLDLLIESPGDLIFFLLVLGLSQATLFLAFSLRSRLEAEQATYRFTVTAIALLGIWLSLMTAALFSLLSSIEASIEASMIMPALERLGMSLSLGFITWAFLSADNRQRGRLASLWLGGTIVLSLILFFYTASDWFDKFETSAMFNTSELAPLWSILPLAIGLIGFVAVAFNFNQVFDAPLKCLFFLLIVLGNGWDSWQFANAELTGSYLGGARWAYLAGLALAPVVIHRLIVASLERRLAASAASSSALRTEAESLAAREREIAARAEEEPVMRTRQDESIAAQDNRQLLRALGMMMDKREEAEIPEQVLATALELLEAEVCLLLRMDDETYANVIASQDNVNSQNLDGLSLSLENQPTIIAAMQRREQRILRADQEKQEVEALFRALKIGATGTAYIQPMCLESNEDEVLTVLLVLMPDRLGELSPDQRALLDDIGKMAGYILAWSFEAEAAALQHERDILAREGAKHVDNDGSKITELRNQLKQLSADHEALLNLREEMRRDYQALLQRYEAREKDKRELQGRIEDLQRQLETGGQRRTDLERQISDLSSERDNLLRIRDQLTARLADSLPVSADASGEPPLRTRLQELQDTVSTLKEEREKLALELGEAKTALGSVSLEQAGRTESREAATAASQLVEVERTIELVREMGAPVSAISDCADILLQESIGILGAAQLEVLQRVTANLGRLTSLLEDLMNLGPDEQVLSYAETDIVDLLDETITSLSADIHQKQLALDMSVDDGLPKIAVDVDCIRQVLRHLLQNACDVSEQGAPLFLTATVASARRPAGEEPVEAIRISVEDKGGGIPAKDLPRVFARKYLRENPKIEGLSDTGVGMTVARAFARAHAGDLWIDSKPGEGSVFHLDLPTRPMPPVGK